MTFRDILPGLSRTLSFNSQDFPGPGICKKKIQDIPGGTTGTLTRSHVNTSVWPCPRRASWVVRCQRQTSSTQWWRYSWQVVVWVQRRTDRTFRHTPWLTTLFGLSSVIHYCHLPRLHINTSMVCEGNTGTDSWNKATRQILFFYRY